jgi:hypothetical protein
MKVLNPVVLARYIIIYWCRVVCAVVLHIVICELRQGHTLKVALADCYNLMNFVGKLLVVWTAGSSDVAGCGLQGCCVVCLPAVSYWNMCCMPSVSYCNVLCCVPSVSY